jgi:hypothetical protein
LKSLSTRKASSEWRFPEDAAGASLTRSNPSARTPTHHALLHSLSTYLTFIKQLLSAAIGENEKENSAGYSKWSSALADVRLLLAVLCEVMCWVSPA